MATTTTNMALQSWDQVGDIYDHTQLANNWSKVDQHNHTTGKGLQIPTGGIEDGAVTADKLSSVPLINTAQLIDGSVTTAKILDGTILVGDLANDAVEAAKIKNSAVTTAKIATANVTLAKLAAEAWTTYTPTWTNVTLGTSPTNTGRSVKIGRTVIAQGILTLGTSTGDITGVPTMTLPYSAAASINQMGSCRVVDSSTSLLLLGYVVIDTGSPTVANFYSPGTQSITDANPDPVTALTPPVVLGAAAPFDWAPGDSIRWAVTYEAAT